MNENELEVYLSVIFNKLKEEKSIVKSSILYFKAKEVFFNTDSSKRTQEAHVLAFGIFLRAVNISEGFVAEWQSGKISPTDEELDILEKSGEEALVVFGFANKNYPSIISDAYYSRMEKSIRELKNVIKQEKACRQQQHEENQPDFTFPSSDNPNLPSNNNNSSNIQALHQTIKNLQSQLSNLQAQPATNNSSELKNIEQSLKQLQNNLQNIEQKKKMDNSSTSQQDKQELAKLKTELAKLQNQLKQSQTNQSQQNLQQPNKFNWLYIVIPLGALAVILGIVIAYLLGKNNKKE